jgi:hypothetical protein
MVPDIRGRVAIVCVMSVFLCVRAVAQEGYYGIGHDRWHREFYSKLNRNDGRGTCCDLMDKAGWSATITKSRWTGNGRRFLTTGSTMWSRQMMVLMSALPGKKG